MKIIDIDIVVPILVKEIKPNSIIIPAPEILSVGFSSIEISQSFQCDVDYLGGIVCDADPQSTEATFRKNPGTIVQSISGLHIDTDYYIKGAGLPVLGNFTYGEGVKVHTLASPIPDEYQLVEYLQSTGTQYLRILDNFDADSEVDIDFSCDRFVSSSMYGNILFSAGNDMSYLEIWYTQNEVDSTVVYRSVRYPSGIALLDTKCSLHITNSGVQWDYDGFLPMQTMFSNVSQSFTAHIIDIFNIYRNTSVDKKINGKLYHVAARLTFEEYDLYPVYRKSDKKPGMYDIVNNTFYTNQGTGEFLVGPNKEWEE